MSENERKKRDFIEEQIRKKPFYRKKNFLKMLSYLGVTICFGVAAGGTFAIVKPWAESKFGEPAKLVIAHEEESEKKETDRMENPDGIIEASAEEETPLLEGLAAYQAMYEELRTVTEEISHSLVTVHGTSETSSWFEEIAENENQGTGLIVAMNHYNVYILTDKNITNGAKSVKVTMPDGTITDAVLQKEDRITRMAIVKVPYGRLEEETLDDLKIAVFDDTREYQVGDPVIALGVDFMSLGAVTSLPMMTICDGTYQKIVTDIIGEEKNGGVLLNLKGQVVGLIGVTENMQDVDLLEGIGIDNSRFLLESLFNRRVMPYLGITGKEIKKNISEGLSMPTGIFVKEVAPNSPAMKMGIKEADILCKMNGAEISDMTDYMEIMEMLKPGDIVVLTIERQDSGKYREMEVTVTLGER